MASLNLLMWFSMWKRYLKNTDVKWVVNMPRSNLISLSIIKRAYHFFILNCRSRDLKRFILNKLFKIGQSDAGLCPSKYPTDPSPLKKCTKVKSDCQTFRHFWGQKCTKVLMLLWDSTLLKVRALLSNSGQDSVKKDSWSALRANRSSQLQVRLHLVWLLCPRARGLTASLCAEFGRSQPTLRQGCIKM